MPEIIDNLGDRLPRLRAWAEAQPLADLIDVPIAAGRRECWYGLGIDTSGPVLIPGLDDPLVQELGKRYLPRWNSGLLLEYGPGVGIKPHVDPACFDEWGVTVNLGEAHWIEGRGAAATSTPLRDGDVVRFRTASAHGVEPVSHPRYSLLFRTILPHFANSISLASR
ncbi:alpha-ketoglutarate-dependent dioxygenase AlkB [Streptomyces sp. NBC_00536]|uniref:hypothetical protein n=1 Tax=Streptomyces sp. NBC_00536 TaxID=2975769 RepID=UPI002E8167B6|nr:hypothetical protein [Streptomyces sp. NBC_00536]WUC83359.1 alpha-ketoglutarate-dependent dioxygenase AlkB [Streptomyces sp. NBC_00536]